MIAELNVGEEIEKSWMTDGCYLSDLVLAYNTRQAEGVFLRSMRASKT
jgi:hypothetical protein